LNSKSGNFDLIAPREERQRVGEKHDKTGQPSPTSIGEGDKKGGFFSTISFDYNDRVFCQGCPVKSRKNKAAGEPLPQHWLLCFLSSTFEIKPTHICKVILSVPFPLRHP